MDGCKACNRMMEHAEDCPILELENLRAQLEEIRECHDTGHGFVCMENASLKADLRDVMKISDGWERLAKDWQKAYDELKERYEPLVVAISEIQSEQTGTTGG